MGGGSWGVGRNLSTCPSAVPSCLQLFHWSAWRPVVPVEHSRLVSRCRRQKRISATSVPLKALCFFFSLRRGSLSLPMLPCSSCPPPLSSSSSTFSDQPIKERDRVLDPIIRCPVLPCCRFTSGAPISGSELSAPKRLRLLPCPSWMLLPCRCHATHRTSLPDCQTPSFWR